MWYTVSLSEDFLSGEANEELRGEGMLGTVLGLGVLKNRTVLVFKELTLKWKNESTAHSFYTSMY